MIPTYCTMTEQQITQGMSHKTLPANSFVKPIEPIWLPKHIKESNEYKYYNPQRDIFVYCYYGIVLIPLSNIRQVN